MYSDFVYFLIKIGQKIPSEIQQPLIYFCKQLKAIHQSYRIVQRKIMISYILRSPYPLSDFECASEHLKWARSDRVRPRYVFINRPYHEFVENKNAKQYTDFRRVCLSIAIKTFWKQRILCSSTVQVNNFQIVPFTYHFIT